MTAPEPALGTAADAVLPAHASDVGGFRRLLGPLAARDFRLVWAGQAVSLLGDQFHAIALAWLVLALTGSGLALGTVLMAAAIPRAILMVVGGALADRMPPRRLILFSDIARGVTVAVLAALVLSGRAELWHLVVMGVVFGVVDALFFPAMNAIVPSLVTTDRLAPANALVQGTNQLANLVGPVAAGVVIAAVGTGTAFAIDAVSFALAAIAVSAIRTGRRSAGAPEPSSATSTETAPVGGRRHLLDDIRAGAGYAFADPAIRTMLVISAGLNLAINGPIAVGLPWLASQRFATDAAVFGVMIAGFGLGALAGAALAGVLARPRRQGTLILGIATYLGIGLMAIGFAPSPVVVLLILATMGLGIGYVNVVALAWLQAQVDGAMLGRVMGIVMLASFGLGPVSLALAGVLVDISATAMFVGAGGLALAIGVTAFATGAARHIDFTPDRQEI